MKTYNGMEIAWETRNVYYLVTERVGKLCHLTMVEKPKQPQNELETYIVAFLLSKYGENCSPTSIKYAIDKKYGIPCTIMQIAATCKKLVLKNILIEDAINHNRVYRCV